MHEFGAEPQIPLVRDCDAIVALVKVFRWIVETFASLIEVIDVASLRVKQCRMGVGRF